MNDTAGLGGTGFITDRQDRSAGEVTDDPCKLLPFRLADEEHLALAGFFHLREPADGHGPAIDSLARDRVERPAEGVLAQDADREWRRGVGVGPTRPLRELRDLVQDGGLDQVLAVASGPRRLPNPEPSRRRSVSWGTI